MTQLQPLLSTADQYRSDVRTLAALRGQLLNLSAVLTAIQEEVGAYDYEELQRRVLLLETRLHSCMNKLGPLQIYRYSLRIIFKTFLSDTVDDVSNCARYCGGGLTQCQIFFSYVSVGGTRSLKIRPGLSRYLNLPSVLTHP